MSMKDKTQAKANFFSATSSPERKKRTKDTTIKQFTVSMDATLRQLAGEYAMTQHMTQFSPMLTQLLVAELKKNDPERFEKLPESLKNL